MDIKLIENLEKQGQLKFGGMPKSMRENGLPLHFETRSSRCTVVGKLILQSSMVIRTDLHMTQDYTQSADVRNTTVFLYLSRTTTSEEDVRCLLETTSLLTKDPGHA